MQNKLIQDLKTAQLERNEVKVSTLRLLISELNNWKIQKGELADSDIISLVQREVKKRKEAAEGFRSGGREESAQKEEAEAKILEEYLPQQLSTEELTKIVGDSINRLGATTVQDAGKVIGEVLKQVAGRADGSRVSQLVREKLS